jgi:hypothetical protein
MGRQLRKAQIVRARSDRTYDVVYHPSGVSQKHGYDAWGECEVERRVVERRIIPDEFIEGEGSLLRWYL